MTTEQFKEILKSKFPEYENYYTILEYVGCFEVYIQNRYGICKTHSSNLRNRHMPTIKVAVDKTSYWINIIQSKYNNNYDYSLVNYKGNKQKIKIICPQHGLFETIPDVLLRGSGCIKCGHENAANFRRKNIEDFKKELKKYMEINMIIL